MAPINQFTNTDDQKELVNFLSSWLATICLLISLIVSLVGIKIWWFKHRLTFEQTGTHNGAAGGSQPILRNNVKDKRLSQQVCDSVVVHGVFRKRQEDELDIIERPKQLPPVRIPERSQSTSALLAPPRSKRAQSRQNIPSYMLNPPTREAPKPPTTKTESEDLIPKSPLQVSGERCLPLELEVQDAERFEQAEKVEHAMTPTVEYFQEEEEARELEEDKPQRLFIKVKPPKETKFEEDIKAERRPAGFLSDRETQVFETLAHKIEDIDSIEAPYVVELVEPSPPNHFHEESIQKLSNSADKMESTFETDTGFDANDIFDMSGLEESIDIKDGRVLPTSNWSDNEAQNKESIWNDIELKTELPTFEMCRSKSESSVPKQESVGCSTPTHFPDFEQRHNEICRELQTEIFEEDFEHNRHNDEEHENDDGTDGVNGGVGDDDDFEKRRHSYQEHEGHFLELTEPKFDHTHKPKGFGKSIDEDWESFQDLRTTTATKKFNQEDWQETLETETITTTNTLEAAETTKTTASETLEAHESYSHHHYFEEEYTNRQITTTSYIQSIEELYDELSENDTPPQIVVEQQIRSPPSILKEHMQDFKAAGYETPTAKTRKLKPQQKVTFDFNTEEHYLPESDTESSDADKAHTSDEDEDDVEDDYGQHSAARLPPLPKSAMPTPMQRTTKIPQLETIPQNAEHDAATANNTEQQQRAAALLFSTQISLDDGKAIGDYDDPHDSWSAIRQRRYQNESFDDFETPPQPASRYGQPEHGSERHNPPHFPGQVPAPRSSRKYMHQLSREEDYNRHNSEA